MQGLYTATPARGVLLSVHTQETTGARWQSGYAAACKAVDAGSIPTLASISFFAQARVAELVDAADLKSADLGRAGSSPAPGTNFQYTLFR